MPEPKLGQLESVDIRKVWQDEAQDFTPWLAKEDNLALLSETLDMELELEAQEKSVGPFRADILCKDTANDSWVLIENQLDRTNHRHVGQLITYSAGLQAVTIIWIAGAFTDEHRAALDWLNEITKDDFRFFGLEIELWKITDSPVAPKFNIVSKPNDWSQSVRQTTHGGDLSERDILLQSYWSALRDHLIAKNSPVKSQTPKAQQWANFAIGTSSFNLRASISTQKEQLQVALLIGGPDSEAHFNLLEQDQQIIEQEIKESLDWRSRPAGKKNVISVFKTNVDPSNEDDRDNQIKWIVDMLERFNSTFRPLVKGLDASEWVPDKDEYDDDLEEENDN